MNFGSKLIALFLVGAALLAFGCLQEKQWSGPTPSPVILPSPSPIPSPTLEVTLFPLPSPTRIPSPSPSPSPIASPSSAAFSCNIIANPQSAVGPFDSIIFATFVNKPADVTSALMKCTESDSGQISEISAQNGAGRTCHYGNTTSTTTYAASASAGSASCTVIVTVNVNASQPPLISSVSVATINKDNVSITWTTDKSSDSKIEYGVSTSYGTNVTNSTETGVTSHHVFIGSLAPSTSYHYRVWSCSSTEVCGVSQDYVFTTTAGPDTTAPTLTLNSPNNNFLSNNPVQTFSFTPVDNGAFANCSLWINAISWHIVNTITTVSNASANLMAYPFTENGSFVWNVQCYDTAGNNAFATANWTINIDNEVPTAPSELTVVTNTSTSINFSWSPATDVYSGVSSYTIFRDSAQIATGINTSSYTDNTVDPNTTYVYTVLAVDVAGNAGPQSSGLTIVTPPA